MDGSFPIGATWVQSDDTFLASNPATGETIDPPFAVSRLKDVADACRLADTAFDTFRETAGPRGLGRIGGDGLKLGLRHCARAIPGGKQCSQ